MSWMRKKPLWLKGGIMALLYFFVMRGLLGLPPLPFAYGVGLAIGMGRTPTLLEDAMLILVFIGELACYFAIGAYIAVSIRKVKNTYVKMSIVGIVIIITAAEVFIVTVPGYIQTRNNDYQRTAKETGDHTLCEKIIYASQKDSCYSGVAIEIHDHTLCEKIVETGDKDFCYTIVAGEIGDRTLCEKVMNVRDISMKDSCYRGVAGTTGDHTLCEKVTGYEKVRCYIAVATKTGNHAFCENVNIIDVSSKGSCYRNVAKATNNRTLCEKIVDTHEKNLCYKYVPRTKNKI